MSDNNASTVLLKPINKLSALADLFRATADTVDEKTGPFGLAGMLGISEVLNDIAIELVQIGEDLSDQIINGPENSTGI